MENKKDILKKYVCLMPFKYLAPFETRIDACCGDWCDIHLRYDPTGKIKTAYKTIEDAWRSPEMQEFRQTILDGTYTHCNDRCPYKIGLVESGNITGFVSKEDIDLNSDQWSVSKSPLRHIKYCSDETCNLHCKSCRPERIVTKGEYLQAQIEDVEGSDIKNTLTRIDVLGSGDPFVSRAARAWLFDFDPATYPNLEEIHIHTNAQMWTETTHRRLERLFPYFKSLEVSIDAASKETYEKIRRGGKWDRLQENLERIFTLPNLTDICLSYVIQKLNYSEVFDFVKYAVNLRDSYNPECFMSLRLSPAEKWKPTNEEYESEISIYNDSHMMSVATAQVNLSREYAKTLFRVRIDSSLF